MEGTSLCIVTMDRADKLSQQIGAIRKFANEPYEIIVVDNGSSDTKALDLLNKLAEEGIFVLRNIENLGLSVATNQGLAAGKYDCLIHLDDDCLITHRGWNQRMRNHVMREEVGLVHPMQTPHSIQHDGYQEITWGLGICWAMPKALFEDIGGYDPQLYHQNECDLGLRVRLAGFRVAGISDFTVQHNDGGGERPAAALVREHMGVVQFRDKWTQYFRGRDWDYGTQPLYLMQHWPPDQEFWRRYALEHGVNLNPAPPAYRKGVNGTPTDPHVPEIREEFEQFVDDQKMNVMINGQRFLVWRELRNDYTYWEWEYNPEGYKNDRLKAIARWHELTGETYTGYVWPPNMLRPQ